MGFIVGWDLFSELMILSLPIIIGLAALLSWVIVKSEEKQLLNKMED
jgi:hypothetical protein